MKLSPYLRNVHKRKPIMAAKKPCAIELEFDCPHIVYKKEEYHFHCKECGESLQLAVPVIEKLIQQGCDALLSAIVIREVIPWLNEHIKCNEITSFGA